MISYNNKNHNNNIKNNNNNNYFYNKAASILERGDFQKNFRIFVAFGPNSPMTIRFNLLCLKMFVSIWKTLHPNHTVREQPNFKLYTNNMNFFLHLFIYS